MNMWDSMRAPAASDWRGGLGTPRRNNYFHGKMLDVYHFEMETAYGIGLRRMLNRVVHGTGVVCGLDVDRSADRRSIAITPGVALDGWGREIVVPVRTAPVRIPPAVVEEACRRRESRDEDETEERPPGRRPARERDRRHGHVIVTLCYQECESDPAPVLAGDCGTAQPCAPGTINERYRIGFEPGRADSVDVSCRFPDVLRGGEIDYGALARWVTQECPRPPRDPRIPLANLRLTDDKDKPAEDLEIEDVEIEIRPVVFGNDILFDLLTRIVEEEQSGDQWRR
jgi:hypothetical protein